MIPGMYKWKTIPADQVTVAEPASFIKKEINICVGILYFLWVLI